MLKELSPENIEEIKAFFCDIFSREPWNDDWSCPVQLHAYIEDLICNANSLTLGLFENGDMAGLSMGSIRHWYSGTEYHIDEFCIKTDLQGKGIGTRFLREVERFLKEKGVAQIFLQTERTVPAYAFYQKNGYTELPGHVGFTKRV